MLFRSFTSLPSDEFPSWFAGMISKEILESKLVALGAFGFLALVLLVVGLLLKGKPKET